MINLNQVSNLLIIAIFSITMVSCSKSKSKHETNKNIETAESLVADFSSLIGTVNTEPNVDWSNKELLKYKRSLDQLQKVYDKLTKLNENSDTLIYKLPRNVQNVIDNRNQMLKDIAADKAL